MNSPTNEPRNDIAKFVIQGKFRVKDLRTGTQLFGPVYLTKTVDCRPRHKYISEPSLAQTLLRVHMVGPIFDLFEEVMETDPELREIAGTHRQNWEVTVDEFSAHLDISWLIP